MRVSWSRWIYHRLRGPNPLHPKIWEGRLSPVLSGYESDDLPQCLEFISARGSSRARPARLPEVPSWPPGL